MELAEHIEKSIFDTKKAVLFLVYKEGRSVNDSSERKPFEDLFL